MSNERLALAITEKVLSLLTTIPITNADGSMYEEAKPVYEAVLDTLSESNP